MPFGFRGFKNNGCGLAGTTWNHQKDTLYLKPSGFYILVSAIMIKRGWGMYSNKSKLVDREQTEYYGIIL